MKYSQETSIKKTENESETIKGKRKWNFMLLLSGRVVSDLGSSIQMLIMPLYILDIGGTAKTIGLFSFLYILPILMIFPFGGVMGDRFNRKVIMVLADLLSGVAVLILALLSFTGYLTLPILLVFQVIVSAFYGFFDPATKGMIPEIVESKNLSQANSKVASLRILAGVLSPMVAVMLYTRYGVTTLFIINGVSFLVSAASESLIKYNHTQKQAKISIKLIVEDLQVGIRFIKDTKTIFGLCTFFLISYAFIHPLFSVVLPIFFRTVLAYPDAYYGYLQVTLFIGALVGSLLAGYLSKDNRNTRVLIVGIGLIGITVLGYSVMLQPIVLNSFESASLIYFTLFAMSLFLLYTSIMLVGIPMQTLIQKETPKVYMSRVFSIVSLITKGGAPLGALAYGVIVESVNLHMSALVMAAITAGICVIYISKFKNLTENRTD